MATPSSGMWRRALHVHNTSIIALGEAYDNCVSYRPLLLAGIDQAFHPLLNGKRYILGFSIILLQPSPMAPTQQRVVFQ